MRSSSSCVSIVLNSGMLLPPFSAFNLRVQYFFY
nr:MAG TPA: hypothetical protein [Caudoviricetes sp.]